ncbi:hypothetical protein V2J09_020565 [Rumex salicifolius]
MASSSADTLGFGFDVVDFSDRILRLEITPSESDTNPGIEHVSSLKVKTLNVCSLILAAKNKFEVTACMKQCAELLLNLPITIESSIFYLELPSSVFVSEIILKMVCYTMETSSAVKLGRSENELNLGFGFDDVDFSDRILRLEITPSASYTNPAGKSKRRNPGAEHVSSLKVKTLNICSLILAAKIYNCMWTTEEAAFMDMLNSVYDRPLNATSRAELVDLLMVADMFEVTSCMKHCVELLLNLPITIESSIFYLELP